MGGCGSGESAKRIPSNASDVGGPGAAMSLTSRGARAPSQEEPGETSPGALQACPGGWTPPQDEAVGRPRGPGLPEDRRLLGPARRDVPVRWSEIGRREADEAV